MTKLPRKVIVKTVNKSRYDACTDAGVITVAKVPVGEKPLDWDNRIEGKDTVVVYTESDCCNHSEPCHTGASTETIVLNSLGDQSTPAPGWVLMLTDGSPEAGYSWTLYGFKREQKKCEEGQENKREHCV
jgi:hypothetical protein